MKRLRFTTPTHCLCGLTTPYTQCCGRWHAGEAAPDAESLMRSRYAAYALQLDDYVLSTWHASTRPAVLRSAGKMPAAPNFIRLEVKRHTATGAASADVEFVAWTKSGGRAQRMHETSHFVHEQGRWWYVDGEVSDH